MSSFSTMTTLPSLSTLYARSLESNTTDYPHLPTISTVLRFTTVWCKSSDDRTHIKQINRQKHSVFVYETMKNNKITIR